MSDSSRICSWKIALGNPIRRLIQIPKKILGACPGPTGIRARGSFWHHAEHIEPGQTVLDIGCGPGTFSIAMAKLVGESEKIIAVDVQEEMLQLVREKAARQRRK
jgi:2-polyprenyl-3-methyl-5-hydroxy-6-metoxy-1,4-benzoquinol methylase